MLPMNKPTIHKQPISNPRTASAVRGVLSFENITLYLVHSSGKVFLVCVGKKMKPNLCRICKSGLIPFIYLRFGYGAGLPSVP